MARGVLKAVRKGVESRADHVYGRRRSHMRWLARTMGREGEAESRLIPFLAWETSVKLLCPS